MLHGIKINPAPNWWHPYCLEVEASSSKEAKKIVDEVLKLEREKEQARWQELIREYQGR